LGASVGVTHRSDTGQMEDIMNKKLITLVSAAVITAIFLLWAIGRLMPVDQSHSFISGTIEVLATLLAAPVRLYALFVYGDRGSWPVPVLILLLALSGLMWGVIVERTVWILSKRNRAQ
jgi:hypothetical protein